MYVSEVKPRGPGVNSFTVKVTEIKQRADTVRIRLELSNNKLIAEIPYHIFEEMELRKGKEVHTILRMRRIRVFENKES